MKVLSKKEGGFYNNKILVVSVLMLMLVGVLFIVYGTSITSPTVVFNSPSTNNTFSTDNTQSINITFSATTTNNGVNVTILNSSVNVTVGGSTYNFSNMTCVYSHVPGTVNQSITCNLTTHPLDNGTTNITAAAMDNLSNPIEKTLQNLTIYSGSPEVVSVSLSDPSPTKDGNVTFNITFNRIMNTSLHPEVKLKLANGSDIGIPGVGTDYNTTYGQATIYNSTFKNDTANRRSTWSGYFMFNTSDEVASIFDGTTTINITGGKDIVANTMAENSSNTFVLDTTVPKVTFATVNGSNQSSVAILFNFTDNLSTTATCRAYINSTLNATTLEVANHTESTINLTPSTLEDALNLTIECNDTAGNAANTTPYNSTYLVYIDQTEPIIYANQTSPFDGHYVKDNYTEGGVIIVSNATDSFTGIRNTVTDIWMYVNVSGNSLYYNFTTGTSTALVIAGAKAAYNITVNLSAALGMGTLVENQLITYTTYAKDFAGNLQSLATTFYVDNTAPSLAPPTDNGSTYTQGDNLVLSVVVTEAAAGLNISWAELGINTSNYTRVKAGNVNLTCAGDKPTYTCTYNYNTSELEAGSLRLNGTVFAADNTDQLKNNGSVAVIWDFTLQDAGAPTVTLDNISSNVTRIPKDVFLDIQVNVTVFDESGISGVWATYKDNSSTTETCKLFTGGTPANTTIIARGNCTILTNESAGTGNRLHLDIWVNDTTGAGNSAAAYEDYTISVENEAINVSIFTVPSTPYVNQTITINTTVYSWYGPPNVWFNVTNSTSGGVVLNATCSNTGDGADHLYYCQNITNTSLFQIYDGNASTITIINASYEVTANDTSLPSALTATYGGIETSVALTGIASTTTIELVGSGVIVTGAATATLNGSNATQDIRIKDTLLNNTVITLNDVSVGHITNFTFDRVAPNGSNGTKYTTIQNSLGGTSVATLLTSLVINPRINNVSTGLTGSTVAFNCSGLGIVCTSSTRVYKASFNTTTNRTTSTWTVLTAPTLSDSNTILTQTVDTFSIFALGTPYVAPTTTTTTTSSSGGGGGGIGYLLVGKVTAFDIIDMIRDFYAGTSTKTAFDIIDKIRTFYEEGE